MHKIGGHLTKRIMVGPLTVNRIMVGPHKVYPNSSLAVTQSLAFAAAGGSLGLSIQVEDGQPWSISDLPAGWAASATSGTGPASVTITASNNTTTSAKGFSIDVRSEDLAASCSVSQAAGTIIYETPIITAFGYPDIPASGGTVSPNVLTYQQIYTWNGVAGSGGVLTTGGTIYYSNTSGQVAAPSLGTTEKARTAIASMTTRVDMNGVTGQNAVCYIYQAANYWWDGHIELYAPSTLIGAAGGEITLSWQLYRHWTSGAQSPVGAYGGLSGSAPGFSINGASVSAENRSTVPGVARSITVAVHYAGLTSNAVTITQEANYVIEQQIMTGNLKFTPGYVSRSGGQAVCKTAYNSMWEWKYTSGETTAAAPPAEYGTISATNNFYASPEVNGATVDWLFGHVTWQGKTSTSMRSVTVIRDTTKTLTPNTAAYPGAPTLTASQSYKGYSYQY